MKQGTVGTYRLANMSASGWTSPERCEILWAGAQLVTYLILRTGTESVSALYDFKFEEDKR